MFLILLGEVGWVPLPSENFRGFLIGPEPTAAETDTVLTWSKKTCLQKFLKSLRISYRENCGFFCL